MTDTTAVRIPSGAMVEMKQSSIARLSLRNCFVGSSLKREMTGLRSAKRLFEK
jgi:hypothetical protein